MYGRRPRCKRNSKLPRWLGAVMYSACIAGQLRAKLLQRPGLALALVPHAPISTTSRNASHSSAMLFKIHVTRSAAVTGQLVS
jgi:hypothetical protein